MNIRRRCQWLRSGDYFHIPDEDVDIDNRPGKHVRFFNHLPLAMIRRLDVDKDADGCLTISVRPAIYSKDALKDLCELSQFTNDQLEIVEIIGTYFLSLKFKINKNEDSIKFIKLLHDIKTLYPREEFTTPLLTDLKNILNYSEEPNMHTVPLDVFEFLDADANNPLSDYLHHCKTKQKEFSKIKFKELLRKGYDTNYIGYRGITLLDFAFEQDDNEILELALYYNADPFFCSYGLSPYENLLKRITYFRPEQGKRMREAASMILDHSSRKMDLDSTPLNKSKLPTPPHKRIEKPLLNLNGYYIKVDNSRIHTYFPHCKVRLEFCATDQLQTSEKLEVIFHDYKKHFTDSPVINDTLEEFYDSEFVGKSKYVEKIYHEDKLSGINLYEEVSHDKLPHVKAVHLSCIFVDEVVRGQGLTNPLVFTLGFESQMIYPDYCMTGVMQSISYGSASAVKDIQYSPKYAFLDELAETFIHHIQRPLTKKPGQLLIRNPEDPLCCYSEIEVQNAVELKSSSQVDINRKLFERQRGRTPESTKDTHRGVMILFAYDQELWMQYAKLCLKMHINPLQYVKDQATEFAKIKNIKGFSQNLFLLRNPSMVRESKVERINAAEITAFTRSLS